VVEGLSFESFRIISEVGGAPFAAYRKDYEKAYGAEQVGVMSNKEKVIMPPDWMAYPHIGAVQPMAIPAIAQVAVKHVDPFAAMRFVPNRDDKPSTNLPVAPQ